MVEEIRLREQMVDVCKKMAERGLVAATDGNVSCRCGENRLLITPSGTSKATLQPRDMICVDLDGNVVRGYGKCSSEIKMHLSVYDRRPDVEAIVHAHPPLLTAFTVAGIPFDSKVLPEVWLSIGPVATASYATPSTGEVPLSILPFVNDHDAILLERHGSLTMGKRLEQAYSRLEKMEQAARTLFYVYLLQGSPAKPLDSQAIAKLEAVFGRVKVG